MVFIYNSKIVSHFTIKTNTKEIYGERIARIAKEVYKFCERINKLYVVDVVVVELPYIGRIKGNSTLKVAEARGAVIGGIASYYYNKIMPPIIDITAIEAKKAVGVDIKLKRDESKKAVKEAVIKLFPSVLAENQDILDAVSVAIAGVKKFKTTKTINNFIK